MQRKHSSTSRFRLRWAVIYTVLLIAYTTFTLLDAFVLPSDVVEVAAAQTRESTTTDALSQSGETTITDTTYTSDNISITLTEKTVNNTQVYIADVYIRDTDNLQSGLAEGSFGRNLKQTTSEIAKSSNAILAINGDYYGFRDSGYVLRNGQLYRTTSSGNDDLVIYEDGTMEIISEDEITAEELVSQGAVQIYSFGPGLIEDGAITVDESSEVGHSRTSNPRTAIGMIDQGHYVFVVSDGRTSESQGLTLLELAQVMDDLGCSQAYNLDGGGSSTMWFNGNVINNPTTNGQQIQERSVSDIVYIGE